MKKQKGERVYLVFKQTSIDSSQIVKIFREEKDAEKYCNDQNELNWHEFDDYGYCEGIYHSYQSMKVE